MTEFDIPGNLSPDEIRRRLATPAPAPAPAPQPERQLMTPAEVAQAFNCDPKTVTRWAKAGKLTSFKTLGGHRRFDRAEVQALIDATRVARTDG